MTNFSIKCHKTGTTYSKPHFFILNKGINCGKPSKEPFTNSFVFSCDSNFDTYFFIAKCLWETKFWHQFLIGSVIPFIHINDFKKEFNKKAIASNLDENKLQKGLETLSILENQEIQFTKYLIQINEFRKSLLFSYIK